MSVEALLERLAVPPTPLEETVGELRKPAPERAGSLSSPSSPEKIHFSEQASSSNASDQTGSINPEAFIRKACKGLPITSDWVHQFVIDRQDVEDIKNGDLPLACLRAHIEYHLEQQQSWGELKQTINHQRST